MEMMSENNMVNFQPESVATFTGIYNMYRKAKGRKSLVETARLCHCIIKGSEKKFCEYHSLFSIFLYRHAYM